MHGGRPLLLNLRANGRRLLPPPPLSPPLPVLLLQVDAHCSYGAACRYGACAVAEGAAEAEATLLCFVDRMDGETLGLLRRDLGLTGNCEYRTCPVDYPEGEQCADRERVANTSVPCAGDNARGETRIERVSLVCRVAGSA